MRPAVSSAAVNVTHGRIVGYTEVSLASESSRLGLGGTPKCESPLQSASLARWQMGPSRSGEARLCNISWPGNLLAERVNLKRFALMNGLARPFNPAP